MTRTNLSEATRHLEEARGAIAGLELLHRDPHPDKRAIAGHYDHINQSLKLAEVEALLYIGGQLAELAPGRMPGVEGRPLSPEQLDRVEQLMERPAS